MRVQVNVLIELIDVITDGEKYLFSLKPNSIHRPQKITVRKLYSKGVQWFCTHADNYLKFVKQSPELSTFRELKHFSWEQIVRFAEIERWNINYRTGGSGDWKATDDGAGGFILVTVGNVPYWADVIGQIPFAVETYTDILEDGPSKERVVSETLSIGKRLGMEMSLEEKGIRVIVMTII